MSDTRQIHFTEASDDGLIQPFRTYRYHKIGPRDHLVTLVYGGFELHYPRALFNKLYDQGKIIFI